MTVTLLLLMVILMFLAIPFFGENIPRNLKIGHVCLMLFLLFTAFLFSLMQSGACHA